MIEPPRLFTTELWLSSSTQTTDLYVCRRIPDTQFSVATIEEE